MSRVRPLVATFAAIGAAIALAGCGAEDSAGSTSTPTPTQTAPSTQAPDDAGTPSSEAPAPVVAEQLKFTAKTVTGEDFNGESLAGKAAVLWFWAPWCPKCQAEAPSIAEAAKATAGSVSFVGVAAQDEVAAMSDFVQKYELGSFPHVADTDAAVWKLFGVTYQPAYAFVSSNGTVEVETNQLNKDELLARARELG